MTQTEIVFLMAGSKSYPWKYGREVFPMESYCGVAGGQQFLLQLGQRSQLFGETGSKV